MRKGRKVYAEVPSKSNSYKIFELHVSKQKQQTRVV